MLSETVQSLKVEKVNPVPDQMFSATPGLRRTLQSQEQR